MPTNKPQPALVTIWRIVLILATLVPAFLTSLMLRIGSTVWAVATACWVLLFLLVYLVYLPMCYKRLFYGICGDKIVLRSGVFNRCTYAIPFAAIQYTALTNTLIGRTFGLTTLVVYAAGGKISIPGLRREDAKILAEALRRC